MTETNTEVELDSELHDQDSILTDDRLDVAETQEPILSDKELYAWYLYAFACEVFAVVSLTSFIPLILEQFSFEKGVLDVDHSIPCKNSTALFVSEEIRCVVNILGLWVDTASYSLYTFSISVVLQAITAISIGATADHGTMRKTLLLSFAFAGSVSAMLFLFVTPSMFLLAGVFAIVGNVCFGASFVCFNGFLPVLVRNHRDVRVISDKIGSHDIISSQRTLVDEGVSNMDEDHISLEETSLLTTRDRHSIVNLLDAQSSDPELSKLSEDLMKTKDHISTHISTRGFASGYVGGIILLIGVFLSGVWWFLFSLLVAKWLRPRPGPPLFAGDGKQVGWLDYITFAWIRLWKTIKHAKKLEMSFRFLMAWFFISDGYTTISSVALLFAKTTLHIPAAGLIIIAIIAPATGVSYCRTLFGELVPRGRETEFFALYAITDKGSSWLGPALVAIITGKLTHLTKRFYITHEIRYGFVLLFILVSLPIPLLLSVDVVKGKRDAMNSSKEEI
ncbi:11701_t:CDS:2 [Acaulospora colombiana]|uniref:11701_t:CDS:1 n=1 Tax=Acaulospora colombiana TaxID=27376 RepID=A0ACA9KJC7_9GLOM|nr:11701_t:CDS:2 [Acaulospora colombiana]